MDGSLFQNLIVDNNTSISSFALQFRWQRLEYCLVLMRRLEFSLLTYTVQFISYLLVTFAINIVIYFSSYKVVVGQIKVTRDISSRFQNYIVAIHFVFSLLGMCSHTVYRFVQWILRGIIYSTSEVMHADSHGASFSTVVGCYNRACDPPQTSS